MATGSGGWWRKLGLALDQIRGLKAGREPPELRFGLKPAVERCGAELRLRTHVDIAGDHVGILTLPIYYVIREALTNARKYATADVVTISVRSDVDVRGAAHEVVERMGLTEQVHRNNTTEEGTRFIGGRGQVLGAIPVTQEQDGPTAELEILRGDLAQLVLKVLPEGAAVRFGDHVQAIDQSGEQVHVRFASGSTRTYDLLVIAEGVRSSTRDLVFGGEVQKKELGLNMAYGTIPRTAGDDRWWRWYTATRRRGVTLRPDNAGTTRATLAYVDRDENLADVPLEEAKARLAEIFADAGWESERVGAGFITSSDVYVDYLTQIVMATWYRGRVVVTGDAAWCVTPLGGGGTSLALIGGYVLAAYLSHATDGQLSTALQQYESWMRPIVTDSQSLPKGTPDLFYPNSPTGVALLRTAQRIATSPPLRRVASRLSHVARTDEALPDANPATLTS